MRELSSRPPSPAMVVALMALFVALGGSSYAALRVGSAQIVNNSVRSKDIRNNDVRSKDIRNGTVRGKDVARDTLTGSDINESRLGAVPLARAALVASSTRSVRNVDVKTVAEGGAAATLAIYGPFKISGRCTANGTSTLASISMTTTEANSALAANESAAGRFGPADGPQPIQSATDTAGGSPTPGLGYDDTFTAFSPSGRAITGVMSLWADASAGASGVCKFYGEVVIDG